MKTVPNSLMLIGSSPWACRGAVYDRYDRWFGVPNEHVLIWQAPTLEMNPSIDPAEIQLEYNLDPINAAAEYGAQFRTDVEVFFQGFCGANCHNNMCCTRELPGTFAPSKR